MAYQVFFDGTLGCDTLDELLAYQAATGVGPQRLTSSDQPTTWTPALVSSFLERTSTGPRELLLAVLLTGGGITSLEFAIQADMKAKSLGNRLAKLQRDVRDFAPSLPQPVWLRGEPGSKVLELDPTFASAAAEVSL
jgi:hypothetical protein